MARTVPRIGQITVIVPVRDEEELLGAALDHLRAAMDHVETDGRRKARLVVVLDACTDSSARIAEALAGVDPRVRVIHTAVRAVGAARDLGVRTALAALPAMSLRRHWIANTDADTRVPPDWLQVFADAADAGADALVGTVEPDAGDLGRQRFLAWQSLYVRQDGHPHIHGANLGVRASTYCEVGGFPQVPGDEDVRLVHALRAHGANVRSSAQLHVITSGRLHGRVGHGFADFLAGLAVDDGAPEARVPASTSFEDAGDHAP
ncbi:glycosyltransferase [Arthrobacter sp.]|uniref:glycosyltransferase n=1 Tax=Arthrobacter sp. TaxID=1667 RepID=UPI003A957B85